MSSAGSLASMPLGGLSAGRRLALVAVLLALAAATVLRPAVPSLLAWVGRAPLMFTDQRVAPWAIIFFAGIAILLRWRALLDEARAPMRLGAVAAGIALLASIPLVPEQLRLAWCALGLLVGFFGRAASLPLLFAGMVALAIVVEDGIEGAFGQAAALAAGIPAITFLQLVGVPLVRNGAMVQVFSGGQPFSVLINGGCAGPTTILVFLSAFTVMALDRPLPGNRWVRLLVLGLLGTWSLNVVRLALLLLVGAIWGQAALETAHANAGYVLFAIWIAVFAGIYLREWRAWNAPERVER